MGRENKTEQQKNKPEYQKSKPDYSDALKNKKNNVIPINIKRPQYLMTKKTKVHG